MDSTALLGGYRRAAGSYGPLARPLSRVGLGVTMLFASLWPTGLVPLDPTFVLFGVSEVLVGALLVADRWASLMAAVVAVSMLGVVVNLAVAMAQGEPFGDVLVRDFGLMVYATGVALLEVDGPPRSGRT